MSNPKPNQSGLTPYVPGESGNLNGRPLKIYTILKESGYSRDDIREAYKEVCWTDLNELQRLFKDDKTPVIIKVICHAFKRAIEKGDYRYVQEIIEQVIGKPRERIDLEAKVINVQWQINENGK